MRHRCQILLWKNDTRLHVLLATIAGLYPVKIMRNLLLYRPLLVNWSHAWHLYSVWVMRLIIITMVVYSILQRYLSYVGTMSGLSRYRFVLLQSLTTSSRKPAIKPTSLSVSFIASFILFASINVRV